MTNHFSFLAVIEDLAIEQVGASLSIVFVSILFCAGIFFFFYRYSRPENEARRKEFLANHWPLSYGSDLEKEKYCKIKHSIKKTGFRSLLAIPLPLVLLSFSPHWGASTLAVSIGLACFGSHALARSWYGLRCLYLLGIDSEKDNAC